MRVSENGNVGIGTTTPASRLHVTSPGGTTIAQFLDPATNSGFRFTVNDTSDSLGYGAPWRHGVKVGSSESLAFLTGPTDVPRVVIDELGNVGIRTTTPGYMLDVNGDAHIAVRLLVDNQCFGPHCPSDARLKQHIAPLLPPLARLLRLRGVTYEWRDPAKHGNLTGTQTGMIAQQVEEVFPEWVGADRDGYKTLTYRGFEALTVESFRELDARANKLASENASLTTKLATLEDRLAALEKRSGPQHASVLGDSRWFGGVVLGGVLGLLPWWARRRRRADQAHA